MKEKKLGLAEYLGKISLLNAKVTLLVDYQAGLEIIQLDRQWKTQHQDKKMEKK